MQYIYIPAIKDKVLFDNMIEKLQSVVYSRKLSENEQLKRLRFKPLKITMQINDESIDVERNNDEVEWYRAKIDDNSKTEFAEYVVPTLEKDAFENFRRIFEIVLEILESII